MMRIHALASALSMISFATFAEMPMTIVTPDNAATQEVQFTVSIEAQRQGDLARITLTLKDQTGKYGKFGQPGLYLNYGGRLVGLFALYENEAGNSTPRSYWCDLASDYLDSSTITVSCYPEMPDADIELGPQSMEYTLNLKDFNHK